MIDVTKPLELSDGTPVKYERISEGGNIVVTSSTFDRELRPCYHPHTGARYSNPNALHLRNVGTAPVLDLTKPLQFLGSKVTLIGTNASGDFPVVVQTQLGTFHTFSLLGENRYYGAKLINVPSRIRKTYRLVGAGGDIGFPWATIAETAGSNYLITTYTDDVLTDIQFVKASS